MKRLSICNLEEAIDYYNDDIVERFTGNYDISRQEAEQIFLETKKWIWLLAIAGQERRMGQRVPRLVIDNYLIFIDEMWHNFILFTKLYQEYCNSKFGFFIHHNPTPQKVKEALRDEMRSDQGLNRIIDIRKEQYSYIYDKLGADTLELWYNTMCDKYTNQLFYKVHR